MFNVGGGEIIVILLIALIVLGPDRLPGAARTVGKVMGDLRRLSQSFQDEMRQAVDLSELDIQFTGNPGPSLPPLPQPETSTDQPAVAVDEQDGGTEHGSPGAGGKLSA
jgi:sec-independent protein translocase protein TatB